jgi:hypothetical protein
MWPFGYRSDSLPTMDVGANKIQLELFAPSGFRLFGFGGRLRLGEFAETTISKVTSLEGKKAGDTGEAAGREWDNRGSDLLNYDKNLAYRDERSQVQMQTVNVPVAVSNAAYSSSMARGALPVHFDVSWEGARYAFQTSLVDPGEKVGVSFAYSRNLRSKTMYLLILALAISFGYVAAAWAIARRSLLIAAPSNKVLKIGAAAAAIAIVLAEFVGYSLSTPIFGAVIGALVVALRWLFAWDKTRPKTPKPPKPPKAPKAPKATTPPAPPPAEPASAESPAAEQEGGAS